MKDHKHTLHFRNLLLLFVLLFLLIGMAAAVVLIQQRQGFSRPKASESSCSILHAPSSAVGVQNCPGSEGIIQWYPVGPPEQFHYAVRIDKNKNNGNPCDRSDEADWCSENVQWQDSNPTVSYRGYLFQPGEYDWWVHAVNSCGQYSGAERFHLSIINPAEGPDNLSVNPSSGAISWSPPSHGSPEKYAVRVEDHSNGADNLSAVCGSGAGHDGKGDECYDSNATSANSTFEAGKTYDVGVHAYACGGQLSNAIITTINVPAAPPPPAATCPRKGQGDADCKDGITIADFALWKSEFIHSCRQDNPGGCGGNDDGGFGTQMDANFDTDQKVGVGDFALWRFYFIKEPK